jgi:hypothetical protein
VRKEIREAQIIPPFYGVSYFDYQKARAVCYPLGVNLVVILWRDLCGWLRNPKGLR